MRGWGESVAGDVVEDIRFIIYVSNLISVQIFWLIRAF